MPRTPRTERDYNVYDRNEIAEEIWTESPADALEYYHAAGSIPGTDMAVQSYPTAFDPDGHATTLTDEDPTDLTHAELTTLAISHLTPALET